MGLRRGDLRVPHGYGPLLMLLPLAVSGSLLAGLGSTSVVGELSPHLDLSGDLRAGPVGVEGYWSDADKIESPGWLGKALLKMYLGPAEVGVGAAHRHTKAWDKDSLWGHAGVKAGPFTLAVEKALRSQNDETKVEGRLRMRHKSGITVEPRAFYERYKDSAGNPRGGWGASSMVGYSWK
jgi:hypothetical protein